MATLVFPAGRCASLGCRLLRGNCAALPSSHSLYDSAVCRRTFGTSSTSLAEVDVEKDGKVLQVKTGGAVGLSHADIDRLFLDDPPERQQGRQGDHQGTGQQDGADSEGAGIDGQSGFQPHTPGQKYLDYDNVPIIVVRATSNNTFFNVQAKGKSTFYKTSCGELGFENRRKSTGYAAQITGERTAEKCREGGIRHVRVALNGIGPGREDSLKGLEMGGLTIVSITDESQVQSKRPKRRRRM